MVSGGVVEKVRVGEGDVGGLEGGYKKAVMRIEREGGKRGRKGRS